MAEVGGLIAGGIVGTLCSELYKHVATLIEKTKKFSPHLEAIKSTVGALKSLIPQIEELNDKLKISKEETDRLQKTLSKGIELVCECVNNPKWYKKARYTDKLTALDEDLKRELDMLKAHEVRDAKETLHLARKHGDQLVESARDGKETLDAVKEINKLINQLQSSWILGLIIIIIAWVIQLIYSLPRERKRIATAVPDRIILSRCNVCKSVVEWAALGAFLVRTFVKLLAYAAYPFDILLCIGGVGRIIEEIRDHYKRGFSGSAVRSLLSTIREFSLTLFVFYVCSKFIWWIAF